MATGFKCFVKRDRERVDKLTMHNTRREAERFDATGNWISETNWKVLQSSGR